MIQRSRKLRLGKPIQRKRIERLPLRLHPEKPDRCYTGLTDDLEARLNKHNEGGCSHTAKYRPWRIETAIAFRSREKAATFETYLKSHSGRAFAKKRL